MTQRFFSAEDANKTLPLVRQIVRDILQAGHQIQELSAGQDTFTSEDPEASPLIAKMNQLFEELEGIGCSYRDWNFQIGLVDFPARINGEEVLLCWRSDEDEVRYYHGLREGYAGRKLIPGFA